MQNNKKPDYSNIHDIYRNIYTTLLVEKSTTGIVKIFLEYNDYSQLHWETMILILIITNT